MQEGSTCRASAKHQSPNSQHSPLQGDHLPKHTHASEMPAKHTLFSILLLAVVLLSKERGGSPLPRGIDELALDQAVFLPDSPMHRSTSAVIEQVADQREEIRAQ